MKKVIASIGVLIVIVGIVILKPSKELNKDLTIDKIEGNKAMALFVKDDNGVYNKTTSIPSSGYVLDEDKSICSNGSKPTWINNELRVSGISNSGVGCYLYFEKKSITIPEMVASHNPAAGPTEFTGISGSDESALLSGEDDDGTTYYFRGNVTDNWVYFAENYWRIVRVNGDGSMRLIYNGPTTDQTGSGTQIGTSAYNENYSDNAYVGLMYGTAGSTTYAATHANTNPSTILGTTSDPTTLLGWYKANIVDKGYSNKVSTDAGFCNDRKIGTTTMSGYGTSGYGTNGTVYAPFNRALTASGSWNTTQTPKFGCNQASSDLFTVSGSSKGNKKLTYPVGLITMDEVIYGGGFGGTNNSSYYLYTNQNYWTMSPSYATNARVFYVDSDGSLYRSRVDSACGVRPVINLSSNVKLSGSGTVSDPYKVV